MRHWHRHMVLRAKQPRKVHVHRFSQCVLTDDLVCFDCATRVTSEDQALSRIWVRAEADARPFGVGR